MIPAAQRCPLGYCPFRRNVVMLNMTALLLFGGCSQTVKPVAVVAVPAEYELVFPLTEPQAVVEQLELVTPSEPLKMGKTLALVGSIELPELRDWSGLIGEMYFVRSAQERVIMASGHGDPEPLEPGETKRWKYRIVVTTPDVAEEYDVEIKCVNSGKRVGRGRVRVAP